MSKRGGDGIGTRKKLPGLRPNGAKDNKDEDLVLFREMHRREKDRVVSLLQPVSDEFEANGNFAFYGMAPPGKKGPGYDVLGESSKNDYDWLKTPPATPLFPSLEMETNGPDLITQREIPIVQPLSRFAGNLEVENGSVRPTISPTLKPKVPTRYSTPSGRPSVSLSEKKNSKSAPVLNQKINQSYSDLNLENPKKSSSTVKQPVDCKDINWNMLASNLSKSTSIGMDPSTKTTKPKSRGVSPLVRSQISVPSDENPTNPRTDRSTLAYRGRATTSQQNPSSVSQKRPESATKSRRQQSRSPGATRGRKQDSKGIIPGSERDRTPQQANRTKVLGSPMVDRFLNSRMSNSEDRQSKMKLNASMNEGSDAPRKSMSIEQRQNTAKFNTSINESSGFGRLMSQSSLDMALRHMVWLFFLMDLLIHSMLTFSI
ncbi:hypothetical protein ACH5RR_016071 [Cinchona calisaya]|uniref:Uncharacterized protein n=1 Tax=Cinchona calisaya TaxID=153742 RepID=A0ABD2ZXM4_9GENT